MKVSIIIPTKNGASDLPGCLKSINRQFGDYEKEIVVIDSQSIDDTVTIAKSYGARVVGIKANDFTHGHARNMGASLSTGQILIFCNQDAVPANGHWLENLVTPINGTPKVVGSYSRQMAPSSVPRYERLFLERYYPAKSRIITHQMLSNRPEGIVLFSTVSAALRREIWKKFKFNEETIMSEDQEIAYRILRSGYQIAYESDSIVFHGHSYTLRDVFTRYFDSGWSMTNLPGLRPHNQVRNLDFIIRMFKDIARDNHASAMSKASGIMHLGAKSLGFSLGQLAPHLPTALRSKLSYTISTRTRC